MTGHAGQTEFELDPISARVHHVAGTRERAGDRHTCGRGSVGRASPCQGEGREFESRRPLCVGVFGLLARWSGREARQRPAKPSTRVQIPSPPPRTISSAGERFPDTEEVTGSIPVSSTGSARTLPPGSGVGTGAVSSAGERFPDTEEVTGSIPVPRTPGPSGPPGRLAQRESASLTRKRSLVQSQYRPRNARPRSAADAVGRSLVVRGAPEAQAPRAPHEEKSMCPKPRLWPCP
jgi:hypothetical protein